MVDVSCRHIVLDRDSLVRPGSTSGEILLRPLDAIMVFVHDVSSDKQKRRQDGIWLSDVKMSRDLQACDHPSSWAAEALGWD